MKTNHTEEQMQAAIDAAIQESRFGVMVTRSYDANWDNESRSRLRLLKAALANLPDPPPPVELEQFSTLLPIAEAGEVPAGCARVTGYKSQFTECGWILGEDISNKDTHFADIRLPVESSTKKEMPCGFNSALDVMPDEPSDPYAELKAAHAAGKVIEFNPGDAMGWRAQNVDWTAPVECYRIKPESENSRTHHQTPMKTYPYTTPITDHEEAIDNGDTKPLLEKMREMERELNAAKAARCDWKQDEGGNWDTQCGQCMCFEYAPPNEQGYKFCHHCGLTINFIKFDIDKEP